MSQPSCSSGLGRAFQLSLPRCFAVAASCSHHIATAPIVRNDGNHGSKALLVVGRPDRDCAIFLQLSEGRPRCSC
jgi:hypothetical protein